MHEITLMITPVPKGRPRARRNGIMYTPKKTADWERSCAFVVRSQWNGAPLDGAVESEFVAVFPRPKRLLRKKDTDGLIWKRSKPDADNICKCALDALVMAGVLRDDSLAVKVSIMDFYAERDRGPRLCLRMRPAGPEPVEGWWDDASRRTAKVLVDFTEEEDGFIHDLPW